MIKSDIDKLKSLRVRRNHNLTNKGWVIESTYSDCEYSFLSRTAENNPVDLCKWVYDANKTERRYDNLAVWGDVEDANIFIHDVGKRYDVHPNVSVDLGTIASIEPTKYTGDVKLIDQIGDDPKGSAGQLKTPMQFIPLNALGPVSEVMKGGAEKYGQNNWLTSDGVGLLTYKGAILRHLTAIDRGEDMDPESGQPHLAHIAASCLILLDAEANGKLIDNRVLVKPQPV